MNYQDQLETLLISHEGLKLRPYRDTASPPRLTIGVGRNLDDRGITREEALYLLANDITIAHDDLRAIIGNDSYADLDEVRRAVLVSMCFNLGKTRFSKFLATIAAVKAKDWERAARQMKASLWAKQVGKRADDLSAMMRTGQWR